MTPTTALFAAYARMLAAHRSASQPSLCAVESSHAWSPTRHAPAR